MLVLEPEALGSNPASFSQIESAGDEKLEKVKRIITMGTLAAGKSSQRHIAGIQFNWFGFNSLNIRITTDCLVWQNAM